MALEFEVAKLLKKASKQGVAFDHCLTIGRQTFLPKGKELEYLAGKNSEKLKGEKYSEAFFKMLGAKKVDSIDFSDYEGASIIKDLNEEIKISNKFDLIFDGGSLEHIFNIPLAVRNYIKMLKVGGRFIGHLPANNQLGHGFYQFSPEFFLRVFSKENGFHIEKAMVIEYGPKIKIFEIIDPYKSKISNHVINKYPVYIYIQARKDKSVVPFKNPPSQYIYEGSMWIDQSSKDNKSFFKEVGSKFKKNLFNIFPNVAKSIDNLYHSGLNNKYSLRNKSLFRRIK